VWKTYGPFLTLGWPQDTTGLEEGCFSDDQFLDLCDSISDAREQILMGQLGQFKEGVLASIFDSLDRVQHMFRRDRPDIVEEWYIRQDALVGRIEQGLGQLGLEHVKLIIVSDHGFSDYRYKVHLNRWLNERGYITTTEKNDPAGLQDVDWPQSQAYAVGLNSIYLNQVGREGKGSVTVSQRESVIAKLRDELTGWRGPDGHPVIQRALLQEEAFVGPLAAYGPDIVVGFSPGYRASAETGLGKWGDVSIESNQDHWGADHCIDSTAVPGVLFCNQGLVGYPHPSYRDFPALTVDTTLDSDGSAAPPPPDEEDQQIIEERLRSLGYL
jgi:hypothetical protein